MLAGAVRVGSFAAQTAAAKAQGKPQALQGRVGAVAAVVYGGLEG